MALPTITPAYFSHSVFDVTGVSDGANFTGSLTSPNGGPSLAAVTSAPSGHCVYRATGIDGWPALEFNGTGGLFGGNATLQSYVNNTAGAGTDKPWTIAWRASVSVINATNHTICLSSSTDADPFVTCGPQFTNPTSSWQARRRDDNTSAGGGSGVLVSGSSTGVHSFVAIFDGTNISLYVDGTQVGSATAASTANAFTITQECWGVLFRQTAGTPIGSPGTCLISKSLIADGAVNSTDRAAIETWLAEAPPVAYPVIGVGTFRIGCIGTSIPRGQQLSNPATENYVAQAAGLLGIPFTNLSVNGSSIWELRATGSAQQPWMAAHAPDPTKNVTAILATNPKAVIVDPGPAWIDYDAIYAIDPTVGSFREWMTNWVMPAHNEVLDLLNANGVFALSSGGARPQDNDLSGESLYRRAVVLQCASTMLKGRWFNQWSLTGNVDGTGRGAPFGVDNHHFDLATHTALAKQLADLWRLLPDQQWLSIAPVPAQFYKQVGSGSGAASKLGASSATLTAQTAGTGTLERSGATITTVGSVTVGVGAGNRSSERSGAGTVGATATAAGSSSATRSGAITVSAGSIGYGAGSRSTERSGAGTVALRAAHAGTRATEVSGSGALWAVLVFATGAGSPSTARSGVGGIVALSPRTYKPTRGYVIRKRFLKGLRG